MRRAQDRADQKFINELIEEEEAAAAAWSEIQCEAGETGQAEPEYDSWSSAREAAWSETHPAPDLEYGTWEAEQAHTAEAYSAEPAGEEKEAGAYAGEEWQETADDSWPEGAADVWSEPAG